MPCYWERRSFTREGLSQGASGPRTRSRWACKVEVCVGLFFKSCSLCPPSAHPTTYSATDDFDNYFTDKTTCISSQFQFGSTHPGTHSKHSHSWPSSLFLQKMKSLNFSSPATLPLLSRPKPLTSPTSYFSCTFASTSPPLQKPEVGKWAMDHGPIAERHKITHQDVFFHRTLLVEWPI